MECELSCPYPRKAWSQLTEPSCSYVHRCAHQTERPQTRTAAWTVLGKPFLPHPSEPPEFKYPPQPRCNRAQLPCLFPPGTNQYAGSFLCLDMKTILTLALGKPRWTKSTMPNIYNRWKIPHPHIARLKMKTELSKCSLALKACRPRGALRFSSLRQKWNRWQKPHHCAFLPGDGDTASPTYQKTLQRPA